MAIARANVFNIPASAPFLRALIDALIDGKLVPGFPASRDPLELARATLYLPTRRACRLARDVFLERIGGDAAVLPRIVPLGRIDEDEINFAQFAGTDEAPISIFPTTLGNFQRHITLAELILEWSKSQGMRSEGGAPLVANTPAAAFALARDLAHLMDDMATRQVPWDKLDGLVPEDLDEYWQKTLAFLKIARDAWPKFLAEKNLLEPAVRQNKLIAAEAERLKQSGAPVIAAGSTGSIPATAELLDTIAKLPNGAVVLPGLDTESRQRQLACARRERCHAQSSAIRNGRAAQAFRHRPRRRKATRRRAGARFSGVGGHASGRADRSLEHAAGRNRAAHRTGDERRRHDRSRQCRGGSARHRGRPARGGRRQRPRPRRWSRPTARSPAACWLHWRAGISRPTIRPATISPKRRPGCSRGWWRKQPSADCRRYRCWRCSSIRFAGSIHRPIASLERAVLRGPRPKPGTAGLAHALTTFRATRGDLHRSDPRTTLTDAELDAARNARASRWRHALAPLETLKAGRASIRRDRASAPRGHRRARRRTGNSRRIFRRHRRSRRTCRCARRLCRIVSCCARRPAGAQPAKPGARAHSRHAGIASATR